MLECALDGSAKPDVVLDYDDVHDPRPRCHTKATAGAAGLIKGAHAVASRFNGQAQAVLQTTLDGYAAGVWQMHRVPKVVFGFVLNDEGRIIEIEQLADPAVLASLDLGRRA